jgi:hypothetical protein
MKGGIECGERSRQLSGGIRVSDGTTDGSAITDLRMGDVLNRLV